MCKKLMFLISLIFLLGPASSALAADLEVPWSIIPPPDGCYVVSGTEEYYGMVIEGCVIVPAGATLIINFRGDIDGDGTDGPGGSEYAYLLVDGGTFIMNGRLDMGCDHDAYLIVDNGGTVINTKEKICIPDNDGGVHRLIVIEGTVDATGGGIELDERPERSSSVQIACSAVPGEIIAKITTGHVDEGSRWDPDVWKTHGPNEGGLYDYPEGTCGGSNLVINDLGGNVKEVYYFMPPEEAWCPDPPDGATEIARVTCPLILSWCPGNKMGDKGAHMVYFGTDEAVCNSPMPTEPGFPGPEFQGMTGPYVTEWYVGTLPLWTTYFWRIDEGNPDGSITKGPCWKFTTGCPLIPGDINLDCLVNFEDYAILLTTWLDEQFFPDDGCTP